MVKLNLAKWVRHLLKSVWCCPPIAPERSLPCSGTSLPGWSKLATHHESLKPHLGAGDMYRHPNFLEDDLRKWYTNWNKSGFWKKKKSFAVYLSPHWVIQFSSFDVNTLHLPVFLDSHLFLPTFYFIDVYCVFCTIKINLHTIQQQHCHCSKARKRSRANSQLSRASSKSLRAKLTELTATSVSASRWASCSSAKKLRAAEASCRLSWWKVTVEANWDIFTQFFDVTR